MFIQEEIDQFWSDFLRQSGRSLDTQYLDVFHFELTERWANELLSLVLIGQKKATASSLLAYEVTGEKAPNVGDLSIVTDWNGTPKCVIETIEVVIMPFEDITFELCRREGEDDSLES